jgi:hypothetical protein
MAVSSTACERGESHTDPAAQHAAPASEAEGAAAGHPGPEGGDALAGGVHRARPGVAIAPLTREQQEMVEQLEAIGYLSGTESARAAGVTLHDVERVSPGLNFLTSGDLEGAVLMDMDGRVLHEWRYSSDDAFEEGAVSRRVKRPAWWRRAYLFPNGDVMAIITGRGLLKIDKNSELLWATSILSHHDLAIAPNGDLILLARRVHMVPRVDPKRPIVEDMVVVLDSEGREKRSFSLLEAFENSEFAHLWHESDRRSKDIFHTNSIELLDGSVADANPAFEAGNLLISVLHLDAIAVVDPEQEKVIWAHTGRYRKQHDPKILPNGNLLLFDNLGTPGSSAVLEYDPATMDLVWEFRGSEEQPFLTRSCGTSERLPNGNTLISETDFGRAFEVTTGGDIVWEFYNPRRTGENDRFIASLPELIRLPADFPTDWLDEGS